MSLAATDRILGNHTNRCFYVINSARHQSDRRGLLLAVVASMTLLGLFLLVGVTLGLLGGGGSILTVPVLVYAGGIGAKPAVAMSLFVVGVTSVFGLVPYLRRGQVDLRVALVFGPVSMAGAFAGGILARYFSDRALLVLFALMMVATSLAMLTARAPIAAPERTGFTPRRTALLALEGAGVGLFTGLVGAGGGFMVVPALVLLAKLDMRRAVGTSLAIIVLKSSAGLAGHLSHVSFDWPLTLALSAAAALGALLGGMLSGRIPKGALRRGFGVFVLGMGGLVLLAQLPKSVWTALGAHLGLAAILLAAVALAFGAALAARQLRGRALNAKLYGFWKAR